MLVIIFYFCRYCCSIPNQKDDKKPTTSKITFMLPSSEFFDTPPLGDYGLKEVPNYKLMDITEGTSSNKAGRKTPPGPVP